MSVETVLGAVQGVTLGVSILACQRWWHWKREAYRTKDASIKAFDAIKQDVMEYGIMGDVSHWPALKPAYPGDLLLEIAMHECSYHQPFDGPSWSSRQDVHNWMQRGGNVKAGNDSEVLGALTGDRY